MNMTLTYETVEHAEDMYSAYYDAMSYIRSAVDTLKGVKDVTASDFAKALTDILSDMEDENEQYDEVLAENERQENELMSIDYWRDVI